MEHAIKSMTFWRFTNRIIIIIVIFLCQDNNFSLLSAKR